MRQYLLLLIIILMTLTSCEKEENEPKRDVFIFPIGRSFLNTSSFKVKIGEKDYQPDVVYDSSGGYWLQFPKTAIPGNEKITITISRKKGDLNLFLENSGQQHTWLNESHYIDSDNDVLVSKANELTLGLTTNIEKAKAIQQFVISHVDLKNYRDSFLDKASETYALGYGTCMNFSRLYVSLCRAADIPARTIWGVVYGFNDDHIYDYHHQWAEILDESGYWHAADFTYAKNFDLNDIRYLDLIYAAEENKVIKNRQLYEIIFNDLKYYNDYPVTLTARLGFRLTSDNRPDSMVVEYSY